MELRRCGSDWRELLHLIGATDPPVRFFQRIFFVKSLGSRWFILGVRGVNLMRREGQTSRNWRDARECVGVLESGSPLASVFIEALAVLAAFFLPSGIARRCRRLEVAATARDAPVLAWSLRLRCRVS